MAERLCPRCKKRPVWRTTQRNNWEHVCKRCSHTAWAADQQAQRAARRATKQLRSSLTQVSRTETSAAVSRQSCGLWREAGQMDQQGT